MSRGSFNGLKTFLKLRSPTKLERALVCWLRGSFIITQKENKGEYGAVNCGSESCVVKPEWKWNTADGKDIYAHVFDQNGPSGSDGTPYQYSTNVSDWSKSGSQYWANPSVIPRCTLISTTVSGKLPFSDKSPSTDKACVAHTHNAGNYYSYPAATAGSDTHLATSSNLITASNSICPKGWQLPLRFNDKSYDNLFRTIYGISSTTSDSEILLTPLSFVRLGNYDPTYGSLTRRGVYGYYRLSTAIDASTSNILYFASGNLSPSNSFSKVGGYSVRCVSR